MELGIADGVDLPQRSLVGQQAQPMGGHIDAAHQSVHLLALAQLGTTGGLPILQVGRPKDGPIEPRALGRLFTDIGDAGLNVEDFELTHDPVRQVGYLSISVERDVGELLRVRLTDAGWHAWSDNRKARR